MANKFQVLLLESLECIECIECVEQVDSERKNFLFEFPTQYLVGMIIFLGLQRTNPFYR